MKRLLVAMTFGCALGVAGCGSPQVNPAGTTPAGLHTTQYSPGPILGGDYDGQYGTYAHGRALTLIARGPAVVITPRQTLGGVPQNRPEFDITSLQVQPNGQIVLSTVNGTSLFGTTHRHGPDIGFAVDLAGGETIEGILHVSHRRAPVVTWAFITPRGRIHSGRQDFVPAPIGRPGNF